jgi:hypothetical protein
MIKIIYLAIFYSLILSPPSSSASNDNDLALNKATGHLVCSYIYVALGDEYSEKSKLFAKNFLNVIVENQHLIEKKEQIKQSVKKAAREVIEDFMIGDKKSTQRFAMYMNLFCDGT